MRDAELIELLRNHATVSWHYITADRIEELIAERDDAVRAERQTYRDAVKVSARADLAEAALADAREKALREAADYIESAPDGHRFQDRDAILALIEATP